MESELPYMYVQGNPVNLTDPSGLCAPDDFVCWAVYERILALCSDCANLGLHNKDTASLRQFLADIDIRPPQPTSSSLQKPHSIKGRVYYLNQIGNVGVNVFEPSPDPKNEQGYILYRVGQVVGPENVKHIPIYSGVVFWTRIEMVCEAFEIRQWSPVVVNGIVRDIEARPLTPGEKLIIIGGLDSRREGYVQTVT